MNNVTLINKVYGLWTEKLHSREQSQRVMVQCSIIRKAFQVKEGEIQTKALDFERERVLSDQEIEKEFQQYIGFWEWAIKTNDQDKAKSFESQVFYFIDGVRFFDEELAESLAATFENILTFN